MFGNSVAIATLMTLDRLVVTLDRDRRAWQQEAFALTPDEPLFYPFLYDSEEFPDLRQFITPQYSDPNGELAAWARKFLDYESPTPTFQILSQMTHGIRESFSYRRRHEHGTQHPLDHRYQTGSRTATM